MSSNINRKIEEAQSILRDLGLPEALWRRRVTNLTFLALCNIRPEDKWKNAKRISMTLSNDIMAFVNKYYKETYAANSRESFRKLALKPLLEQNIILHNPDNPNLKPNSALNHYSITDLTLETILKFESDEWPSALDNFKFNQFPENKRRDFLIRKVKVENFKSITNNEIQLGRINVFIGENGCGKSNILESLALISASVSNDVNFDGLYGKGVRIARPNLMVNSFLEMRQSSNIDLQVIATIQNKDIKFKYRLYPEHPSDIYTKWKDKEEEEELRRIITVLGEDMGVDYDQFEDNIEIFRAVVGKFNSQKQKKQKDENELKDILSDFSIFDLNTRSLRGIVPVDSRKTPLGINGEGLDLLISTFNSYEREQLMKSIELFSWLDDIKTDKNDKMKLEGLKPGRSSSTLYFSDRFMQKQNNILSAENSNEGILHVLFYLALFISNRTPRFFAIDNIETALNPKLCQKLIRILAILAKERSKQVLITTHNPAILDGLNVADDEQRLFEVYRTSEGYTKTRRIQFKSDLSNKEFKLSEMWMKGSLGAIPMYF